MKQPNRENSHGVKPTHSDDDWLVAYENHVVLGGPAPGDFPEGLSDQDKQELSDARRAIDALHGVFRRDRAAAEPATTEQPLHQLGDFQILHEIGRGGMGVVYEAQQRSVGRNVALKVLPFAAMLDKQQLNRFKIEARAAGTLDHPNIVSVFSVGTERGVHYYAMQLIDGQSLAELIADLRKQARVESPRSGARKGNAADQSEIIKQQSVRDNELTADYGHHSTSRIPQFATVTRRDVQAATSTMPKFDTQDYFRGVAELGIQAAQALDHAHQNGIVHRDVKPGNLLLDAERKLWVTDFGLARIEADASMTMTGYILGTLCYMSPEQALAKRAVIDYRTDIYSLGATLYELLTLTAPFAGCDRQEILHKITFAEPVAPRKINAAIPVEMETIVLKASAKDPADRYATAQELADDLNRFMDGMPVQAHRIGPVERLWRWSKRNPMVAMLMTAVATLATLVAVVASIGYAWTTEALAEAQHQGQMAAEERDHVEQHFHAARDAVDRMLTTAASELVDVPHSSAVRRKLLEAALEFYEGFLKQKGSDPAIRYETALAYYRAGIIRHELGDRTDAVQAYQEAIQLLEKLFQEYPKEATYGYKLARCASRQAFARQGSENELSIEGKRQQLKLMQRLAAEHPQNLEFQKMMASAHALLGTALQTTNRFPESIQHHRQALDEWEQLYKEHPELPKDPEALAFIRHWLGAALMRNNQLPEAESELHQAHALQQKLVDVHPESREYRRKLAHIMQYMAQLHGRQSRPDEAENYTRQAIEILEKLVEDFPADAQYRSRLSGLFHDLGNNLVASGRHEEGLQAYQAMIEHREAVYDANPDESSTVRRLSQDYIRLGLNRYMADELDEEAVHAFRRTQQLCETYLKDHPDDPSVVESLADFLAICPAVQFQDPARAIELVKPLLQQSPRDGDLWGTLGTAHYAAGEWEKGIDALNKANKLKDTAEAWDLFPLAMCQWHLGQREEARQSYDQAVDFMKQYSFAGLPVLLLLRSEAAELLGIDPDESR